MSPRSLSDLRSRANIFSFDAADSSFEVALQSHQLSSSSTPPLHISDKYLPLPIGMQRAAIRFAFESEVGAVSDVFENDQTFVVARLTEVRPEGIQPLKDVRDNIERTLQQEAAKEQVELIMANLREQLAGTDNWEAAAASFPEASYAVGVTASLAGSFSGIGRSVRLAGVLKTMTPGQVNDTITLERGEVIVRLVALAEPDQSKFKDVRETEHQLLFNRRLNTAWVQWITDLKEQAKIIDRRHAFF